MPSPIRYTLIAFSLLFVLFGGYYRIRSLQSGERLDRTKEGWPIMIGVRIAGLLTLGSIAVWLSHPEWFSWATVPMPMWARWLGAAGFGLSVLWLIWMFRTLGRNLTDTVVVRRDAYLVERGPYRFVRNPMYTGILMIGIALGLGLGTWLVPAGATMMFVILALRTRREEIYLIERFGDSYRDYMQRVGRFFPKLP